MRIKDGVLYNPLENKHRLRKQTINAHTMKIKYATTLHTPRGLEALASRFQFWRRPLPLVQYLPIIFIRRYLFK